MSVKVTSLLANYFRAHHFSNDIETVGELTLPKSNLNQLGKICLIFSRQGYLFLGLLIAMLAISINYNNTAILVFVIFLLSLLFVSVFNVWQHMKNIDISFSQGEPGFAGQPAYLPCTLYTKLLPDIYHYEIKIKEQPSLLQVDLTTSSLDILLPFTNNTRGKHDINAVVLSCQPMIGICKAELTIDHPTFVITYPAPSTCSTETSYASLNETTHEADEFSYLREYHHGDPVSRIHWKSVAHGRGKLVKIFNSSECTDTKWIDWDVLGEVPVETKLATMARLISDAEQSGVTYGIRLPNNEVSQSKGNDHKHHCLTALALFN